MSSKSRALVKRTTKSKPSRRRSSQYDEEALAFARDLEIVKNSNPVSMREPHFYARDPNVELGRRIFAGFHSMYGLDSRQTALANAGLKHLEAQDRAHHAALAPLAPYPPRRAIAGGKRRKALR